MKKYIIPPGSLKHGVSCGEGSTEYCCECGGVICNKCIFGKHAINEYCLTKDQISISFKKIWKECNTSE